MWHFLNAKLLQPIIVQPPSDVIMTSKIIQENIFLWKSTYLIHLSSKKSHILCGNGIPGTCHSCNIVKHMAFRFINAAKIRQYLGRFHHHFSQKQYSRAYNLTNQAHHTYKSMDLWQISGFCSQFLPYIGYCIQTDHIDSAIGKEQHVIHHIIKYHAICIIKIPLIWIKGGHHYLVAIRQPGEIPRCGGWKDLGCCFFIPVGNIPIIIKEIPASGLWISGSCCFCPGMVFTGMVHYKIQTAADSLLMA